ncbi:MFS transporter [Companilactobacillus kimchii]|uniref:Major facilitator superfamily permease n=2 Tax=Companilactobacillus kimchii TaxID=2801452 RepID=A0ABR5NSS0_9LACO|nr:MFS transporter [Companilactobacillus kimchii]KAE9562169.1 MFS transporter [Companilactobacillus kimchii]KRK51211.1 major facilitator superfamily permease [Companilactobacillus kimchii DSM 13961 = JCM 10707]OWF34307.1 Quinolone resistance protein NorB [Companilactobacillus kimchii]GEO46228.1 MFS transporter [Companilactobacillus paralimentarius]
MKKGWLMKFSLLSISLVLTSAGAISGNIPAMAKTFSNESLSSVEMLTTIPALMVVIFVILSSFIAKKIGQKQTVILGLIIALISGIIPAFSSNFTVVLVSRALLGVGFGLFNSLAVSMISDYFTGDERAQLIGFQSAFQGLGTAIMTYVAGQLLKVNWHVTFWIYAIILPILVLFILFVPSPEKKQDSNGRSNNEVKQSTNMQVIGYVLLLFVVLIIYMGVQVKLALLFTSNGYGTATDAANIISIMSIGSMLAGFAFGTIFKIIRHYTIPVSIVLMAISFFILAVSNSIVLSGIGGVLTGISFSLLVPYLFNQVSVVSPKGSATLSTSLLLVGSNLGSSFSPYGLALLGNISGTSSVNGVFMAGGTVLAVMAIIGLIFVTVRNKKFVKEG